MFENIALPFEVKQMLMTGASFIYTHATWILLVLVVLYVPVTISLLLQLMSESSKKNDINTKTNGKKKTAGTGKKKTSSGTGKKRSGSSARKTASSSGGRKRTTAKRALA